MLHIYCKAKLSRVQTDEIFLFGEVKKKRQKEKDENEERKRLSEYLRYRVASKLKSVRRMRSFFAGIEKEIFSQSNKFHIQSLILTFHNPFGA
jgi:hypothetical protein